MPQFGLSQFDKLLSEALGSEPGVGSLMPAPNSTVAHPPTSGASTDSSPGHTQDGSINENRNQSVADESPASSTAPNEGVKTENGTAAAAPGTSIPGKRKKSKKVRKSDYKNQENVEAKKRNKEERERQYNLSRKRKREKEINDIPRANMAEDIQKKYKQL